MYIIFLFALLGLVFNTSAESLLEPEDHFFGIPNADSLSWDWFIEISDFTDIGCFEPMDIEVLRLSEVDYRFVILDAFATHFLQFRMDQQNGINGSDLIAVRRIHNCNVPVASEL